MDKLTKKERRIERLEDESNQGINALREFKELSQCLLEQKAEIMDLFEKTDTLEVEQLQEAHRKYRALCNIEQYFVERVTGGQVAENKLQLLKDK